MTAKEKWDRLCRVPVCYLRKIGFGKLKGKSDINPQWRIKAFSEVYGECGVGWYFDIANEEKINCQNGEVLILTTLKLYTKTDDGWSKPIVGKGGNKIVEKNKNGLVPNDEGEKMALTDALGTAMKLLGVASEIYEGNFDGSKYRDLHDDGAKPNKQTWTPPSMEVVASWLQKGKNKEDVIKWISSRAGENGSQLSLQYIEDVKNLKVG